MTDNHQDYPPGQERLWQLKEWAGDIDELAQRPTVRAWLRELIEPLAEQDKAYQAAKEGADRTPGQQPSSMPPDDPCDMLTYRIPGTRVTKLHAPYQTTLPALGSERAERQRQAIMVVGIHDHYCQVRISDGIWTPGLLDRVWERMMSDPPAGPTEDAIGEALNWLRAESEESCRLKQNGPGQAAEIPPANTPNNLSTRGTERAITRHEIIVGVANNASFFRDRWAEFCQRVEGYVGELEKASKGGQNGNVSSWLRSRIRTTLHFLQEVGDIWAKDFSMPATLVNPASWFGVVPKSAKKEYFDSRRNPLPTPGPDDQLLRDAVLLCVVHYDYSKPRGEPCICDPQSCEAPHFDAGEFISVLSERLRPTDGDAEIQMAWNRVKRHLPKGQNDDDELNSRGSASETQGVVVEERHVQVDTSGKIRLPEFSKPLSSQKWGEVFQCSGKTILRRIKAGALTAQKDGRRWRFRIDQLPAEYVQKAIRK